MFQQAPSDKEVRLAQENLWVYSALLTIIKNVNKEATGQHNALIKRIMDLAIADAAAKEFVAGSSGHILRPSQLTPGGQGGMQPPPQIPRDNRGAATSTDGRYVDAAGKPLEKDSQAPPEFVRMPIYLKLMMDQREVHKLLAECANSPLPVEVRQLRINQGGAAAIGGGGGARRAGGANRPDARRGPAVVGGPNDPAEQAITSDDTNPYDVPVDVHGIIYIFNPPDQKKLGTPAAAGAPGEGAPPGDQAAPPAQP